MTQQNIVNFCIQIARVTGCADGTREGFFNEQHVAGCKGTWAGLSSLRDPPTNVPCGNKFPDGSAVTCNVPADVCDVKNKWRVCGSTGKPSEITSSVRSASFIYSKNVLIYIILISQFFLDQQRSLCDSIIRAFQCWNKPLPA